MGSWKTIPLPICNTPILLHSILFTEPKPQQTGTGLLIRFGEVATTSGSTISLPRGVTVAYRTLTPTVLARIQARQPFLASRASPARW